MMIEPAEYPPLSRDVPVKAIPHESNARQERRSVTMKSFFARTILRAVVLSVFLLSYVITFASDQVDVTVLNHTQQYLHVVINNEPFLYVAPGGVVQTQSGLTAFVEVFYSPGQSISGSGQKELTSTVTEGVIQSTSCSDERNDCENSTGSTRSESPLSWTVIASDLSSH